MNPIPIVLEVSKRYKVDALRVLAFLYISFFILHILVVNKDVEFLRSLYSYLNNAFTHLVGIVCVILATASVFTSGKSPKIFLKKLVGVFQNEVSNLPTNNFNKILTHEADVVEELKEFSLDAEDLYIFSGSADFLNNGNLASNSEFQELANKGNQCRILISKDYRAKIENLWELSNKGVKVKTYPKDNLYLRGRIKKNDNGNSSLLYNKKNDLFIQQQIDSKYVSTILLNEYDELFAKGKNPFIRKILIGNRHVWCDEPGTEFVLNTEVSKLGKELRKKGYEVIIHTDCEVTLINELKKKDIFEDFDVFSSKEKSIPSKDTAGFYTHLLNSLNCHPYECVFIDDRSKNLKEAKKSGMKTIKVSAHNESRKHEYIINGLKKLSVIV